MTRTVALAAAALVLGACSAIVGGDPPPTFACRVEGTSDPCSVLSPPQRCVVPDGADEGTCQSVECGIELCANVLDDDCDGTVDEGTDETCNAADDDCDGMTDEGLDADGDGYSWCPTAPTALDCDDDRDDVHPGDGASAAGTEGCDGFDNDCNAATPDGFEECTADEACQPMQGGCTPVNCMTRPALCAADQFCDETDPPTCRPIDTTCFNIECAETERCDPSRGACVTPRPNGAGCDHDSECTSNLCVSGQALRATPAHLDGRLGLCSRACCSDADCDPGARCWTAGNGARACVPEAFLALGAHGAPTAEACAARAECSDECIVTFDDAYDIGDRTSMACGEAFVSAGSCSSAFDCPGLEDCYEGRCGGGACSSIEGCANGLCVSNGSFSRCRHACGTAEDCPRGSDWLGNGRGACTYVLARSTQGRDDYVPACTYDISGTGGHGEPCTQDTDCLDSTCLDDAGEAFSDRPRRCAATCCSDNDCGSDQCRPAVVHGHWEMHCLPRPSFPRLGVRPS